jgi:acylpyruvate hydrolase
MRDFQYRSHQWLQGKAWSDSTPLGPFLVTPDEVGDPHRLDIRLELNGRELQSANTSMMIFDIPTLLATISEFVRLEPGDIVLTGTPSGVGIRRDPPVLLADGDRVVVEIERVGRLENPVVAEAAAR